MAKNKKPKFIAVKHDFGKQSFIRISRVASIHVDPVFTHSDDDDRYNIELVLDDGRSVTTEVDNLAIFINQFEGDLFQEHRRLRVA